MLLIKTVGNFLSDEGVVGEFKVKAEIGGPIVVRFPILLIYLAANQYKINAEVKLYYLFFFSTLKINVPFSVLPSLLIVKWDWSIFFEPFPYMLGGLGIVASLLYKEILEKEAYYFYYNSGIPKRNLIISVFAVYWFILWIMKLCIICLK